VNFVIPHFGAGYFREALMLCDLCPNVYLDTSSNSWVRYQPESLDLKSVFRKALEVAGPRRLLFGSDSSFFPCGWHAQVFQARIQALRDIEIPADHASLILSGNLEGLLARTGRGFGALRKSPAHTDRAAGSPSHQRAGRGAACVFRFQLGRWRARQAGLRMYKMARW
jgi:hypothetical protein